MNLAEKLRATGISLPSYGNGNHKVRCPKCSETRKNKSDPCLSVTINDDGALYHCHHCDWKGALNDRDTARVYQIKPRVDEIPAIGFLTQDMQAFFAARGISAETLQLAGVGSCSAYIPAKSAKVPCIAFPYKEPGGKTVNIKFRTLDKNFAQVKGAKKILFGWNRADPSESQLTLCEGEIDALSLTQAKVPNACSVPDGASDRKWEFLEDVELANFTRVVIAGDADEKGAQLADELARRFGFERCWKVEWPQGCKDANDVLVQHGEAALDACVKNAKPYPISGLHTIDEYEPEIWELYHGGKKRGLETGWPSIDNLMTIRGGELSVITGIPGSGKSEFVDALNVNLAMKHKWTFAVCSFENPPEEHFAKYAEKYLGMPFFQGPRERMNEQNVRDCIQWAKETFFLIRTDDEAPTVSWILEKARVAVIRHGVKGLVIDPYNEIEHQRPIGMTETEYVSDMLNKIKRFARNHDLHVWFIAHPAKPQRTREGDFPVPSLYDISGCYSADTEVLTDKGWKPHAEVGLADRVCIFDPNNNCLRYEHPEQTNKFRHDGDMHHYSGYSLDLMVTPEHRMVLQAAWERPGKKTGNENLGRPDTWSHDGWQFARSMDLKTAHYKMPMAAPLWQEGQFYAPFGKSREAFWQLVGWYVTEGWVAMRAPAVCQAHENSARVRDVLVRLGLPFSDAVTNYNKAEKPMWTARVYRRGSEAFCDWIIKECGKGAQNKKLPDAIWWQAMPLKQSLFDALIAGDGHARKDGSSQFCTSSPKLADDVQRLAIELGMYATITSLGGAKPHHKRRYQLNIGRPDRTQRVLVLPRNRKTVKYSGDVYCLTVSTGAYVTRRNGTMAICGNSANWSNKADLGVVVERDYTEGSHKVTIHVKKVRFKSIGKQGTANLQYDRATGIYSEESRYGRYGDSGGV